MAGKIYAWRAADPGPKQRPLRGAGRDQRNERAPRGRGRVCAAEQRRRDGRLCQASGDQQQASLDRQHRRRVADRFLST